MENSQLPGKTFVFSSAMRKTGHTLLGGRNFTESFLKMVLNPDYSQKINLTFEKTSVKSFKHTTNLQLTPLKTSMQFHKKSL